MFFIKIKDWISNLKVSKNTAWKCVFIGGFLEMFWVSGLKHSTAWWQYGLTSAVILISFVLVIIALKRIEVGITYSVFVGLGAAGVVLAEIVVFGEEVSWIKIALIATLLGGVLGLKFSEDKEGESGENKGGEDKKGESQGHKSGANQNLTLQNLAHQNQAFQNLAATNATAPSHSNGGAK